MHGCSLAVSCQQSVRVAILLCFCFRGHVSWAEMLLRSRVRGCTVSRRMKERSQFICRSGGCNRQLGVS